MQRINALVNAGALPRKDLPMLKLALRKHLGQKIDMIRLPRRQRDVLTSYFQATSGAALGSQQAFSAVKRNIMADVELDGDVIAESSVTVATKDPPQALLLQRKGIRVFPDGKKVALYVNKQLNLVFSIPYAGTGQTQGEIVQQGIVVQSEEVEDVMENIDQVVSYATQEKPKTTAKHMKFSDGSKLKVSHGASKAIHMVYDALNDENKKKFANMLTTPKGFEKAAHFALSKVEYKIGGK